MSNLTENYVKVKAFTNQSFYILGGFVGLLLGLSFGLGLFGLGALGVLGELAIGIFSIFSIFEAI